MKVMQENIDPASTSCFDLVNTKYLSKIIKNLNTFKATQHDDIPTKIMKDISNDFPIFFL